MANTLSARKTGVNDISLKVVQLPSRELAYTNKIYLSSQDAQRFGSEHLKIKCVGVELVFLFDGTPSLPNGSIGLNSSQRDCLNASLNQVIFGEPFVPKGEVFAETLSLTVRDHKKSKGKGDGKSFNVAQLEQVVKDNFAKQFFTVDQVILCDVAGVNLEFVVTDVSCVSLESEDKKRHTRGILQKKTNVTFIKDKNSTLKLTGTTSTTSQTMFGPNFNFEQMGIGGLDREFQDIFRRAFASRVYPIEVVQSLGIRHVKGILLHGPPGTGKTLIARKIGQMLNAREPKLVNGPEVLNKYVGQSEENVRALFADAEAEYKDKGDESELHIIIFDEIDAICKERGSRATGGTGVGDSIVNQLLSKMDGVNQINNILVIGMTNRKDLIDEALLRPGRLELHIEIGLPDEHGRVQILNIHTKKMRDNKFMDETVNIQELAALTKNYSGAEIEGLVNSATSFALHKNIDAKNLKKPDPTKLKVSREDFMNALTEVRPAFGVADDDLEMCIKNGIIFYGPQFEEVYNQIQLYIQQVRHSARTPTISLLLSGKPGCGKTALAAKLGLESGFPFVKLLSPESFIGYTEHARVAKITKAFDDAYKSATSLIIVDDIERFLDYVPMGSRFSNVVLQALLVLFKKQPPKGRKLLVIGTTSAEPTLREMEFLSVVNAVIKIPSLKTGKQVSAVLEQLGGFAAEDRTKIQREFSGSLEMKKLINLIETSKQAEGDSFGEKFLAMANRNTSNKPASEGRSGKKLNPNEAQEEEDDE